MELPQLKRFIEIVKTLRDPKEGCPWDIEQTHKSLTKYLVEESYEFIHAVDKDDQAKMEEEIGDVLLQVILHSQIASERGDFNIESVAKKIGDKIIHRHPHVFQKDKDNKVSVDELHANWEKLKRAEKKEKDKAYISMEDSFMPALMGANKIGIKTNKIKFDWNNAQEVIQKVDEEWDEFKDEVEANNSKKMYEELGDFMFTIAQLARHLGFDPEECLRDANQKFIKRFGEMEKAMNKDKLDVLNSNPEIMEKYWQKIKKN